MSYGPRMWKFVADMNYDGSITISDVWLWFKWLYFYPGDGLIYLLIYISPKIAHFFELTDESYGGILSFILSFFVWFFSFLFLIFNYFRYDPREESHNYFIPSSRVRSFGEERELCPDETCIGIIEDDRCTVCGREKITNPESL